MIRSIIRRTCLVGVAAFVLTSLPLITVHVDAIEEAPQQQTNNVPEIPPPVRNEAERRVSDMRTSVEKEIEQKRESRDNDPVVEKKRKSICENRQKTINNKLAAFSQAADKHLTKLNSTFEKVQAYQTTHKLPLVNYSELVAATNEKKQIAADAVAALKVVANDVDCAQKDTAIKLSTVRDAARAARQALQEYRMSIKDIVLALAQAEDSMQVDDSSRADATNRKEAN